MSAHRNGNKWTIPELIALEREHELLDLTVHEIAIRHNRTVTAIVERLTSEGIIDMNSLDEEEVSDNDKSVKSDVDKLSDRVWNLETSVNELVKELRMIRADACSDKRMIR